MRDPALFHDNGFAGAVRGFLQVAGHVYCAVRRDTEGLAFTRADKRTVQLPTPQTCFGSLISMGKDCEDQGPSCKVNPG
jgi:hypothetical protein